MADELDTKKNKIKAIREVEFIQQRLPYGTVMTPGKRFTLRGLHLLPRDRDIVTEDTEEKGQPLFILGWPKSSLGVFCKMLQKTWTFQPTLYLTHLAS